MPFLSKKQSRFFHTEAGARALGGKSKVKEWEQATDYSKLPERATRKGLGGAVTMPNKEKNA